MTSRTTLNENVAFQFNCLTVLIFDKNCIWCINGHCYMVRTTL